MTHAIIDWDKRKFNKILVNLYEKGKMDENYSLNIFLIDQKNLADKN